MHKPLLADYLRQLNSRELRTTEFPYVEGDPKRVFNHRFVVVFIMGGVTYEEAALVASLNAANPNQKIILGGTCIHNSRSFLADLSRTEHVIDIEEEKRD
eukprot:TRINITY_DN7223_c0_g2_i2.p1 TRINITY_DN7223_c0_g2~~TRINITY_DN7223_c0_g2_i2.p1  ORF type:complete len:100 (+),score=24.37 TRINITY_DN7223_c0_g2_i2:39-338(+)